MTYQLVITEEAAKTAAAMDDLSHELFILAALDLPQDPYRLGSSLGSGDGERSHALGGMGFIVYDVDDTTETVTVLRIIWMG